MEVALERTPKPSGSPGISSIASRQAPRLCVARTNRFQIDLRTCLERLKAGRLHAPLCTEGLDAFDIRNAPDAARFARRETDRIVDFAEAFSLPIDPSKAERSVDCLRPRDTGLARALFIEYDP